MARIALDFMKGYEMLESLVAKLHGDEPFLSIEVSPALSGKIGDEAIAELEQIGLADCFVCTDSPLARLKPSSILSSIKLQNALKKPVICTLSMRDRNSIALCGDILGANEFGLRAFLCLTGDSVKNGDCKECRGVFEDSSLKLHRIIAGLNSGVALNGKTLKHPVDRIYNFSVINSYANNTQNLVQRMRKKMQNSPVEAFFTQPVYSLEAADFLLSNLSLLSSELNCKTRLILGFFPVLRYRVALFLRDKLPGVYIPNSWIDMLYRASLKDVFEERKVGLNLSQELFYNLQSLYNKFHFMSANNPTLIREFK